MDELRDYRFYADDMIHTSEQTTLYIWEKFREVLVSRIPEDYRGAGALLKMLEHRPMKVEGQAQQKMEQASSGDA